MRIIGVVDLRNGQAVHAAGGRRDAYAPVAAAAGVRVAGDAMALGRAYVEVLGVRELYVADLDAIERGSDAMQVEIIAALAGRGVPLWVDAGVSTAQQARKVLAAGASVVIVGLETLPSFEALGDICAVVGADRVAFSVDLRNGALITAPNAAQSLATAPEVARRAAELGVGCLIILDLARVGTGAGVDVDLMTSIRSALPGHVQLVAGGGVRNQSDVDVLTTVGCDAVLSATALIRGTIHV